MDVSATDLRYPIGHFTPDAAPDDASRRAHIEIIAELPVKLHAAVGGLNEKRLLTPYRAGGWHAVQVVHHLADSHMNAYVRFKLALTEDVPTVKPYEQGDWAELSDTRLTPMGVSLMLLDSLHARWTVLLREISAPEWGREYIHPETGRHNLDYLLGLYSWHSRHHTAHITSLRERMGW
jgi:hypothetical protein